MSSRCRPEGLCYLGTYHWDYYRRWSQLIINTRHEYFSIKMEFSNTSEHIVCGMVTYLIWRDGKFTQRLYAHNQNSIKKIFAFITSNDPTYFTSIVTTAQLWCMITSSNRNIFHVTGPLCGEFTGPGEFPTQRPVTQSYDVFFNLRLNKRLSKQPWSWWFETPSWSLWR